MSHGTVDGHGQMRQNDLVQNSSLTRALRVPIGEPDLPLESSLKSALAYKQPCKQARCSPLLGASVSSGRKTPLEGHAIRKKAGEVGS